MKKTNYQWQGEPVKVECGESIVCEDKNMPLHWMNYEALSLGLKSVPSVKITHGNESFVLANHFGIAAKKLIMGGWPDMPHFSILDDSFYGSGAEIPEINDLKYRQHEKARDKWQEENYSHLDVYKKSQSLKEMIKKSRA